MVRADVLYLIAESPQAHGVFEEITATRRMVYCTTRSVTMNEYYRAKDANIEPTIVFILADYSEYRGEKMCEFNGKQYRIVRTYTKNMTIELTVEEATNMLVEGDDDD